MSNGLEPDQDLHSVSPDLGSNCLQRLSAADKSPLARKEIGHSHWSMKRRLGSSDHSAYRKKRLRTISPRH